MIRALHRWPALLALVLVSILSLSGATLSVFPVVERFTSPQAEAGLDVAGLATRIQAAYPGVEQIRRSPSGRITAYWFKDGIPGAAIIDPATGRGVASADPNQAERWLTNLHRSLFLGDAGRVAMAAGAASMLVLALSGSLLVVRRTGGWRRWFAPLRGPLPGRLHVEIARIAVFGLFLSSATALWMSASTFDLLPSAVPVASPIGVSGETGIGVGDIPELAKIPVDQLRSFSFPYPGDASDVFTIKTGQGAGYIDQGNGRLLAWSDLGRWERVSETIYMLHTGQGAAALGAILGLMAISVPAMAATGVLVWFAGWHGRPRIEGNAPASAGETILLVGSEGGSTWGFAATLHAALSRSGQKVHVAAMSAFDPCSYRNAERIIILAATYGEGDAPASAKGFLDRLSVLDETPAIPLAILGFGDRSFPAFCAFAKAVHAAADARGWPQLLPFDTIDRQSPQQFARWGRALGDAMGLELELEHQPSLGNVEALTLVSRRDHGAQVQAPTAILRFAIPRATIWQRMAGLGFCRFRAGDLIGVLPQGSTFPRLYSLASSHRDGFIEIVVRKHPGGLCSGQLMALEPGDTILAFLRPNPGFQPGRGKTPLILVGAGTGIGPLAGFIRANTDKRPVHLFFGMRHPYSDFLFGEDLPIWHGEGKVARITTAVSRGARPRHVQDALRSEAAQILRLVRSGARIMVCGGRDMAEGVASTMAEILAADGLGPAALKAKGRYVEDAY